MVTAEGFKRSSHPTILTGAVWLSHRFLVQYCGKDHDLQRGSVSNLPQFTKPFDEIFTINSIHFWNEPIDCLKELRKVLKPDGLIAVTLQPRSQSATDATTKEIGKELVMKLEHAGFSQVRLKIRQTKPVSVACALGIK
jgi:hypothetical protein